jgi:signal transduction histidine kinase
VTTIFIDNDFNLSHELRREVFRRAIGSAIGHIILMSLFFFISWEYIKDNSLYVFISAICIFFNSIRIIAALRYKNLDHTSTFVNMGHDLGVVFSSLCWGVLFTMIYLKHGLYVTPSLALYVLVSGISGGAVGSLSSQKKLFLTFMFFILIVPGVAMIYNEDTLAHKTFGLFLIIYAVFLTVQSRQMFQNLVGNIRMEKSLSNEKQRLEEIFNSLPGLIAFSDSSGNFSISNKEWKDIYPESISLSEIDFLLGEKIYYFQRSKEDFITQEIELGEAFRNNIYIMSLKKIAHSKSVIISLTDITKSKHDQIEIQKHKETIQHTSRMVELGEAVSGVAHEIKNPLSIAISKAQLAERHLNSAEILPDKIKGYLKDITLAQDRVLKIIDRMRSIARKSEDDPFTAESINSIFEVAYLITGPKLQDRGITFLKNDIALSDVLINCRPSQIEQVIINLINNAADAIEKQDNKWIRVGVEFNNKSIQIKITDSGSGIPSDVQEKIWQSFYTTKDIGKGTGLGLSISKQIIEAHKGTIEIDNSSPNTCFVITLERYFASEVA